MPMNPQSCSIIQEKFYFNILTEWMCVWVWDWVWDWESKHKLENHSTDEEDLGKGYAP